MSNEKNEPNLIRQLSISMNRKIYAILESPKSGLSEEQIQNIHDRLKVLLEAKQTISEIK